MSFTTAEKALIDEVVYEELLEYKDNLDISKAIFPVSYRNEGDSIVFVKEGQWPEAQEVAEASEVPIYEPEYTPITKVYKKVGYRAQITHEMFTDSRWDLMARASRKAGEKIALKMSIDVLREAWNNAGQSFTVSGRWGGEYADELGDVADVEALIRTVNYLPDKICMHPKDYAALVPMDVFVHKEKGGDIKRYETTAVLLDLEVLVTPLISENNFLVWDYDEAGLLIIREDLRRASYEDVPRDVQGQVFFIRYIQGVLAPSAICFATGY